MKGFSKVLSVLVLSLFCSFFVGMDVEASGTGINQWISTTGSFNSWSISLPTTDTSSAVRRFVPTGTFYNVVSTSTSGYTVSPNGLANQYDWNGNSLTRMYNILHNGQPTPFWVNNDNLITGQTVYLNSVYPSFSSSDYALSSVNLNFSIPNPKDYMVIGEEYDFSFVLYYPAGLVCSDYISVPTVVSNFPGSFDGTAMFTPNSYVYCTGTYIPVMQTSNYSFVLSFYMPSGYSLSGFSSASVKAMFNILPSDSNIVLDAVTRFPGSSDMDASKGQLDGVISDYDQVEGSLFDSGQTAFDAFDPSSLLSFSTGITAAIANISKLMVSIISAMGEFNVIYTVGVVMVFFGMLIGIWRFSK